MTERLDDVAAPERAGIRIERASADDLSAVRELLREAELPTDDLSTELLDRFLVARRGSDVVGSVAVERLGADGLLRSLAVEPARRGGGLGRTLTRRVEAAVAADGIDTVYLLTTTAEAFFGRLGYEAIPRSAVPGSVRGTEEFRTLCPDTAVCMVKRIGAD